jgi:hypothetical protein
MPKRLKSLLAALACLEAYMPDVLSSLAGAFQIQKNDKILLTNISFINSIKNVHAMQNIKTGFICVQ